MNYKKLTLQELKSICKKNHIKRYSSLNKDNLIKIIKKNLKSRKKMKGGNNGYILTKDKLSEILSISPSNIKNMERIELI
jgi:hypothetical protein